jgi:hypothetical protein
LVDWGLDRLAVAGTRYIDENEVDVVQHLHSALETNLEFPRLESMSVVNGVTGNYTRAAPARIWQPL